MDQEIHYIVDGREIYRVRTTLDVVLRVKAELESQQPCFIAGKVYYLEEWKTDSLSIDLQLHTAILFGPVIVSEGFRKISERRG